MKLLFTFGNETKEGFDAVVPLTTAALESDSIEAIEGVAVLERVSDLTKFVEECYRLLRVEGVASFTSAHFRNDMAWTSPSNLRGISELSLNFASKEWRNVNHFHDPVLCDFTVSGTFAIEAAFMQRAEDARAFMLRHYNNVIQSVIFTLTKKAPQ